MERQWIITRVDGKIASVSVDYNGLRRVVDSLLKLPCGNFGGVTTSKLTTDELLDLSANLAYDDLMLFGTDFQKNVWEELFKLNHTDGAEPRLLSYSEFATICGNRPGIRAVAHALGKNPVPVIIPCHRVIPKESLDRISEIEEAARKTIFKGADLWLFDAIDFGEYSLGKDVKRDILAKEFSSD